MPDFFKTWSDTFRSVLIYGREQEPKKIFITVQEKLTFLLRCDHRNTFFRDQEI